MPILKIYHLFISHAWTYNTDYYRIEKMLDNAPNFQWKNYSVPGHDPLLDPNSPRGKVLLLKELEEQIRPVHCVLVISGMYVNYREWIQKEINIAKSYGKPIIGIKPWGQERVPQAVQDAAKIMVGWNTDSVIHTIRNYSI
jgi:hypothetical protein